jgi:hypothetical protein
MSKVAALMVTLLGLIGLSLAIAGVYILAGIGWSMLVGAFASLGLMAAMLRGLTRGQ